jgi:hypothetical protein
MCENKTFLNNYLRMYRSAFGHDFPGVGAGLEGGSADRTRFSATRLAKARRRRLPLKLS